jgi:hypothetical protein
MEFTLNDRIAAYFPAGAGQVITRAAAVVCRASEGRLATITQPIIWGGQARCDIAAIYDWLHSQQAPVSSTWDLQSTR